jgi:hypothetical protein
VRRSITRQPVSGGIAGRLSRFDQNPTLVLGAIMFAQGPDSVHHPIGDPLVRAPRIGIFRQVGAIDRGAEQY